MGQTTDESTTGVWAIRVCTMLLALWAFSLSVLAQSPVDSNRRRLPIDADFLFNYYQQDGEHSAVTGGRGTEALTDWAGRIIVNVPLDSGARVAADLSMNRYSSASTDRIDFATSSASSSDIRAAFDIGYAEDLPKGSWSVHGGGSIESDYYSGSFGARWNHRSEDGNRTLHLSGLAFFDSWLLYFPVELRDTAHPEITTDKRRSYQVSIQWDQVLGKRVQAAFIVEPAFQHGLLSTPFHRTYVKGESKARLEVLPNHRFKLPLALRLNAFFGGRTVLRTFYRYYWDSFGIQGHSASVELPILLGKGWSIIPTFRYHRQNSADNFRPYGEHLPEQRYRTSDFDLSAFHSEQAGLGIRWAPASGIRFGKNTPDPSRRGLFQSIGMGYSWYQRSDGLEAHAFSSLFAFRF